MKKYIWLMLVPALGFSQVLYAKANSKLEPKQSAAPLISLPSAQGERFLWRSRHKANFFNLMDYFTTEKGLSFCAPASIVMELNALSFPHPLTPEHYPYALYNQDNLFATPAALAVTSPAMVGWQGMTLAQVSQLLSAWHAKNKLYYANKVSLAKFRKLVISTSDRRNTGMLCNYSRAVIGQPRGAHVSPVAAYDAKSDRVLVLDVARYKFPPQWIKVVDLWKAMRTRDSSSKSSRGFVIIYR